MSFARFEELLKRTMGLTAASIGASAIERAVGTRLRACKLEHADQYWAQIQHSGDEVQKLIEAVVVSETWFYRDPQAFTAMARVVMTEWLPANPMGVLRLLSVPCSTGEEPYTLAMALIEAGLPTDRFRIDAIDISSPALASARLGIYGGNSFRGQNLAYRERHFERVDRVCRITESVRGPVRFAQGNLLATHFLSGERYDIVFCRNLLIYFDIDTQNRAVTVLKRLLGPKGMLFVGHSETSLMLGHDLASAKIPMAFAFRKASVATQIKAMPASSRPFQPSVAVARKAPLQRWPLVPFEREAPSPDLGELRRIADRGELAEAARGCEAYVRERGVSPDVLLLLGLISDASGNATAAAGYYRQLLYLDPGHGEGLSHLALLLKKQGDVSGAKVLNDRLRRLEARGAA